MLPPDQSFNTNHAPGRNFNLRLIVKYELNTFDRALQFLFLDDDFWGLLDI